jgi:hypothetical protein
MNIRPIPIGVILFGLLALGGAVDGVRRQFVRDPFWFSQNWRSVLKGATAWIVVGGLAVVGGIVAEFV